MQLCDNNITTYTAAHTESIYVYAFLLRTQICGQSSDRKNVLQDSYYDITLMIYDFANHAQPGTTHTADCGYALDDTLDVSLRNIRAWGFHQASAQ